MQFLHKCDIIADVILIISEEITDFMPNKLESTKSRKPSIVARAMHPIFSILNESKDKQDQSTHDARMSRVAFRDAEYLGLNTNALREHDIEVTTIDSKTIILKNIPSSADGKKPNLRAIQDIFGVPTNNSNIVPIGSYSRYKKLKAAREKLRKLLYYNIDKP